MGSMIPKEIKYNLHYDDVRGDFLRSPQCTTPATVEYNKSQKRIAFGNKDKNYENRRLGLIESLHMQRCSLYKKKTRCFHMPSKESCRGSYAISPKKRLLQPYFSCEERVGACRPLIDLSHLNQFVSYSHF